MCSVNTDFLNGCDHFFVAPLGDGFVLASAGSWSVGFFPQDGLFALFEALGADRFASGCVNLSADDLRFGLIEHCPALLLAFEAALMPRPAGRQGGDLVRRLPPARGFRRGAL